MCEVDCAHTRHLHSVAKGSISQQVQARAYGGGRVQEGYSRPRAGGSTRRNGAFRRNAKNVADRLTSDLFSDIMAKRLCKEFQALQSGLMPHTLSSDIYFFILKQRGRLLCKTIKGLSNSTLLKQSSKALLISNFRN